MDNSIASHDLRAPSIKTPSAAEIGEAARLLARGGLVAAPTETVYGLAADARNDRAVAEIYAVKGRPIFNPLIIHVDSIEAARRQADFPPLAEALAAAFWPGPLTLVLPRRPEADVSLLASAGLDTLAVRVPAHPVFRALLEAAGGPLAAPSANPSGAVSPTTAAHVAEGLGDKVDIILDGGPCAVGLESTIVKVDEDSATLLRPGGAPRASIEAITGPLKAPAPSGVVAAPGMLSSHYAPGASLRLNVAAPRADEAFLAFGPAPAEARHVFSLSESGDDKEAAAALFAGLRALDKLCETQGLAGIAAAPIPNTGLGEAINDRLARAAAPKE